MDATLPLGPPTPPAAAPWKPRLFTIWTGQAFSLFGSQLVQFALIWYLTERTQSGTVLSTAALAGLLPQVFLSPLIGPLAGKFGVPAWFIVGGAVCALLGAVGFVLPPVRNSESRNTADSPLPIQAA